MGMGFCCCAGELDDLKFAQYHGQPFFQRVKRIRNGVDADLFNPLINQSEEFHHNSFTSSPTSLNFTYSVKFFKGSVFLFAGDRGVFKYDQIDDSATSSDGKKTGRVEYKKSVNNSWNPRAVGEDATTEALDDFEGAGVSNVFLGNGNGSRYGYEQTPFMGAYDGHIDKTGTGMFIASGVGGIKYWKFEDAVATDLTGNTSSIFKHIVRLDDFLFVGTQGWRQPETVLGIGSTNSRFFWADYSSQHNYPADIAADGVKVYRITSGETPTLEEYTGNGHLNEGGGGGFPSVQMTMGPGGINSVKKGTDGSMNNSITAPQVDYPPDATATLVVSGGSVYRAAKITEVTDGKIASIGLEFYTFDNPFTGKAERHFRANHNNVKTLNFAEAVMDATSINSYGLGTAGTVEPGKLTIRGKEKALMGYTMREVCLAEIAPGDFLGVPRGLDSHREFGKPARASVAPLFNGRTVWSLLNDFNQIIFVSDIVGAMPSSLIDVKGEEVMGFFQGGVVINGKNFPHIINSNQGGCDTTPPFKNFSASNFAQDSGDRNLNYQWSYGAVDVAFDRKTGAVYVADSTEFTLNGAGPGYYNPCYQTLNGIMTAMDGLELSAGLIVMTKE
jgi:hypothetical protein